MITQQLSAKRSEKGSPLTSVLPLKVSSSFHFEGCHKAGHKKKQSDVNDGEACEQKNHFTQKSLTGHAYNPFCST